MKNSIPQITSNKLAHLQYIYEHGSFIYYPYKGNHFENVDRNFNKATFDYLYSRGLITHVYENYYSDIWDISSFGAMVLSLCHPGYAELDLKFLFKRIKQPFEVWKPHTGMGLYKTAYSRRNNVANISNITR